MGHWKCALIVLLAMSVGIMASQAEEASLFDRSYRAFYRVYEECQQRNIGVSPCIKKKAITFLDRLGRIDNLPLSDSLELVKVAGSQDSEPVETPVDLEQTLGRTGSSKDDLLNDILIERAAKLMNGFNVQIRLPRTNASDLKRSLEEGRGKMKKMMGS